jgi:hypothetical protein
VVVPCAEGFHEDSCDIFAYFLLGKQFEHLLFVFHEIFDWQLLENSFELVLLEVKILLRGVRQLDGGLVFLKQLHQIMKENLLF